MDEIDRYVAALSALLSPHCPRARICDELRAELRAMAHELVVRGEDPQDAAREAVRSMGSVRLLARSFERAYRPGPLPASWAALRNGALAIWRGHTTGRAAWLALAASALTTFVVAIRYLYPA